MICLCSGSVFRVMLGDKFESPAPSPHFANLMISLTSASPPDNCPLASRLIKSHKVHISTQKRVRKKKKINNT